MASRFCANLEEYYLDSPTQGDLDRYEEARRPALANPLEKGTVLAWNGPNLYPYTFPPSAYPPNDTPEPSPNPPRPLLPSLLAGNSPSQGGTGWFLRLTEAVQQGEDGWAQIWRCEVLAPGTAEASSATVVLKLRHQSLFPPPDDFESAPDLDMWNWLPAKHVELREATAYTRFRPYQGRDVPLCYGFYTFDLPSNETVVGVALEDLVDSTIPLSTYFRREAPGRRLTLNRATAIALSTFRLQHRLQSCKMTHKGYCLSNSLAFRKSLDSPESAIVAVGFGRSKLLEVKLQGKGDGCIAERGGQGGSQEAHGRSGQRGTGGGGEAAHGWRRLALASAGPAELGGRVQRSDGGGGALFKVERVEGARLSCVADALQTHYLGRRKGKDRRGGKGKKKNKLLQQPG